MIVRQPRLAPAADGAAGGVLIHRGKGDAGVFGRGVEEPLHEAIKIVERDELAPVVSAYGEGRRPGRVALYKRGRAPDAIRVAIKRDCSVVSGDCEFPFAFLRRPRRPQGLV